MKKDAVDILGIDQRRADIALALNDVDDPVRDAGVLEDLTKHGAGNGGVSEGFQMTVLPAAAMWARAMKKCRSGSYRA
ncbi:hypothetical protein [uncultured Roseibium sp.]|uniref:hypothetical protein n=1 Tax=uncultured Roseibium sp. TaxID=1936171 RepID=UPI0032171BC1